MSNTLWGIWVSGIGYGDHWLLEPHGSDMPRKPWIGSKALAKAEASRINAQCDETERFEARLYIEPLLSKEEAAEERAEVTRRLLMDIREWLNEHILQAGAEALIERIDLRSKEEIVARLNKAKGE